MSLARAGAAGLALLLAAGCSGGGSGAAAGPAGGEAAPGADIVDCTAPRVLVLAVAAHANVSAPDVPAPLGCLLRRTIESGGAIGVVAIDGTPSQLRAPAPYAVTAANANATQDDRTAAFNDVVTTIRGAVPDAAGSDVLGAISLSLEAAATAGPGASTRVVVVDSGLSDRAPLDLTAPGMLAADPADVARFVAAELPRAAGVRFDLVGLGSTVAPQERLGQRERNAVAAIWTRVLTQAGATSVAVVPFPRERPGPRTPLPVRTVRPAPPATFTPTCETTVFDDGSPLGFRPGVAELRDPAAARRAIAETARWVAAAPGRRLVLTGTTASAGGADQRRRLAGERAAAVRDLFVAAGVPAARIRVVAAGYRAAPPDHEPGGPLDPAAAALNRTVQLRTTGC